MEVKHLVVRIRQHNDELICPCTDSCKEHFCDLATYQKVMKPEMRVSIKDYRRSENLTIPLVHLQENQDFEVDDLLVVGVGGKRR